jgi:hypothetical protein
VVPLKKGGTSWAHSFESLKHTVTVAFSSFLSFFH